MNHQQNPSQQKQSGETSQYNQKSFDEPRIEEGKSAEDKSLQIICYNCGDLGHYNTACTKPRVCFVCFKKDHIAENCPRWKEPIKDAQYMGSASNGLGFFHLDVEEKENMFKLWIGFDNCEIFTIKDGELDQEGIISHLRKVFNKDWVWQLKQLEDYKYLVRIPPNKKAKNFVINDGTYFYLNDGTVMASLEVLNGNIILVGKIEEV
jgi:hypothetical protein